jgi:hypothetical protein
MPGPSLTADELAEELGRKTSWLYDNWRTEVAEKRLPPPLNGGRPPLAWDRAQVHAVRDRELTRPQQISAAVIRAAYAAADETRLSHSSSERIAADRAALDRRFAP